MTGVAFLRWALPRLQLRWEGFRRNARQVCHRIDRRRAALGLPDLDAYRALLESSPDEWRELDRLCRVTISRFARDRPVWDELVATVFPRLAHRSSVRAWSAGCGAGEEPYTLAIAWQLTVPASPLEVIATDRDEVQLRRAAAGEFPVATLRELPAVEERRLRDRFRDRVTFLHHDVRSSPPPGDFDLVLCRNLAFSYFDDAVQLAVAATFHAVLRPGGVLVVGNGERVPADAGFFAEPPQGCILRATNLGRTAR
jgi:chemotaxis protein methyltransferase CheR